MLLHDQLPQNHELDSPHGTTAEPALVGEPTRHLHDQSEYTPAPATHGADIAAARENVASSYSTTGTPAVTNVTPLGDGTETVVLMGETAPKSSRIELTNSPESIWYKGTLPTGTLYWNGDNDPQTNQAVTHLRNLAQGASQLTDMWSD